ncbi:protein FAR1-RELATED SEQUENCE 4-like [Carex rostrata]
MRKHRIRYCSWHILHKLPTKWGNVSDNGNEKIKEKNSVKTDKKRVKSDKVKEKKSEKTEKVKEVVYNSQTRGEFEEKWIKLMDDLGKENDPWFRGIFELREKWVPRESLKDFVENFEAALKNIWQNENDADFKSKFRAPKLHYELPMEAQFQHCYTNEIFYKCQHEIRKCANLSCKLVREEDGDLVYEVRDCRDMSFMVIYRRAFLEVQCICRKFEAMGILCAHCIQVLKQERIFSVEDKYIVERWRKDVQRYNLMIVDPAFPTIPEQGRLYELTIATNPIIQELLHLGSLNEILHTAVFNGFVELRNKVAGIINGEVDNESNGTVRIVGRASKGKKNRGSQMSGEKV